ncbi:MAG: FAD-dependent oxidoreductase [Gammaproteobacteria bacterium SG8_11]|nr:MAG: FAD-dependent oxidoreductase [Gammaproteobacteria bacterium SG8_11]
MSKTSDFLVIGGGVIGLNLALLLKKYYIDASVVLVEKEKQCALHASGRNSGVLHAGFYYTADSLKARFTREGNKQLTEYCIRNKLRINRCGKIVVAKNEQELALLHELKKRGDHNKVELELITEAQAKQIEPRVKTFEQALFSPTTSSVDPYEVMRALYDEVNNAGVEVLFDTAYLHRDDKSVVTNQGCITAGFVVNTAGLYADKIALDYGFSADYRILPFKGLYLYGDEPQGSLKTNIYPVPDLNNPFLGVHFTQTVDGKIKIGPTAIPAFWREQYNGFKGFKLSELTEILARELGLFARNNFGFRRLALNEISKYYKPYLIKLAADLVEGVDPNNYRKWGKPGIRAQLVNIKKSKLEMDFIYEGDKDSFHVLNAVSPAFTCAIPFTKHLLGEIKALVK